MQTLPKTTKELRATAYKNAMHPLQLAAWIIIGVPLILVILECLFAIAHVGEEAVIQLHPYTGFGHLPNNHVTCRQEGYSRSVFNSLGARDWEPIKPKTKGVTRIVMMGDSVTEAIGVPSNLAFGKLLQTILNKKAKREKFEVLNFGSGGYGTLQEYYHYLVKIRAQKPDVVVLGFHQGDVDDNFYQKGVTDSLPRPYCIVNADGNLVTDWSDYRNFVATDRAKPFSLPDSLRTCRLYGVCAKVASQLSVDPVYGWLTGSLQKISKSINKRLAKQDNIPFSIITERLDIPPRPLSEQIICTKQELQDLSLLVRSSGQAMDDWGRVIRWNEDRLLLTCGIIHALAKECRRDGCRFILMGLPAAEDNGLFKRQMITLERIATQEKFDFIDINNDFNRLSTQEKVESSFSIGGHLKVKGHELVASELARQISW